MGRLFAKSQVLLPTGETSVVLGEKGWEYSNGYAERGQEERIPIRAHQNTCSLLLHHAAQGRSKPNVFSELLQGHC